MGKKSRKQMTGLTIQGRQKRSNKRKEEEKKAERRARRALARGLSVLAAKKRADRSVGEKSYA